MAADELRARILAGRMAGEREGRGDHLLNPGTQPPAQARDAAVLVPIVARPAEPTILLTRRNENLVHHPGQISFPGGRIEPDDPSPEAAALREANEEIGLDPGHVEVIGRLDTWRTGTGFVITPVVGLVRPDFDLRLDPSEVTETFEVPLGFIVDPANHERHSRDRQGMIRYFWALPYLHYYIWGATAGMLVNLSEVLRAEVMGERR